MEPNEVQIQRQESFERFEKLYAMLLDAIPSSVLLIDPDLRIVSANRNFLEKSQRSAADTVGQRLENVFPAILLDHMDLAQRIRQVFRKNQPIRGERVVYRAPGVPARIYYYSFHPFSWKGTVESTMLLMEDVTEQVRLSEEVRRMEHHLASIVESASDIVLSTDTEGRILTWNTAAESLSGYTFKEVKGHFFFEYCAREFQEEIKKVFASLKDEKSSQMAQWDLIDKAKSQFPYSWVCSLMKEDLSKPRAIVALGRDLTAGHKFQMQLLQSQKLAALGVMAGGIAHEIRNPLAICSSAAQFLMKGDISPDFRKECADKVQKGIQRASDIIENLLKFARPSPEAEMAEIDLLSVLNETITLIFNQLKIQKIELRTTFPKGRVLVRGIANLIQQVFMNLFLNAINAMPDGGVLTISAKGLGNEVLVGVADTGHGISREDLHKIFDPFYTALPKSKGTGLGLSLCYSIVKLHFGSIEADSVEGKGSTFTIKFPIIYD